LHLLIQPCPCATLSICGANKAVDIMNVFKLKKWVLLCCFTLPFMFLAKAGNLFSVFSAAFYILLFIFLINPEHAEYGQPVNIRYKIECGIIACLVIALTVADAPVKGYFDEPYNSILSVLIFGSFIDLAVCLCNLWRVNPQQPRSFRKGFAVFLALIFWPLGIFHLQWLYQQKMKANEAAGMVK